MARSTTACLLAALISTSSYAGTVPPGLTRLDLFGTDGTNEWRMNPGNVPFDSNGDFEWGRSLPEQVNPRFTVSDIVIEGNIDPILNVSFSVTNNTAVTQSYLFAFGLPIVPGLVTPASINGGSASLSLTDGTGDGATASNLVPATDAFYTALLDGVDYETIDLLDPALTAGSFGSNNRAGSFGDPIPSQIGPSVNNSIGLRFEFTLTPGDSAGVSGVLVVEPVPEPGSLALFAVGAGLMVRRRRRA